MSGKILKIKLPARYLINTSVLKNPIIQLLKRGREVSGSLIKWAGDGGSGHAFVSDGSSDPSFYLLSKRPKSTINIPTRNALIFDYEKSRVSDYLDLSAYRWLDELIAGTDNLSLDRRVKVLESWRGAFHFVEGSDNPPIVGLRRPQLGALHGIQAHWSVSDSVATVVMPTGTGKTETMLAITVLAQAPRVLVVVPTDALRTQLAEKFWSLGILKSEHSKILSPESKYPIVGMLCHTPKTVEEVIQVVEPCNIIVTTSSIAARCDDAVRKKMTEMFPYLYIDEAHHTEAPTWKSFKDEFSDSRIVQFTATPFREDEKYIDGKIVFRYPLSKAQDEEFFRPISFCSVVEFNPQRSDEAIAAKAIEVLREDVTKKHILMARTKDIHRALFVYKIYENYPEFSPVMLHSQMPETQKTAAKQKLFSGEAKIVVCVDMLGEGFDLPELKIAAFHDIRKSLAVTLQLAGRFTRSRSDLGNATFIANTAEISVREELQKLYSQDPDWNSLLPPLSDGAIDEQVAHQEYLEGFTKLPSKFPLREISPAASTVIYKTKCKKWTPHAFSDGLHGADSYDEVHVSVNDRENMLVAIVGRSSTTAWCELENIRDWTWSLFVILWDEKQKLLFIHGSNNQSEFKSLAIAVGGEDVELIRGANLFRCFDGFTRLMLTSVGLSEQLGRQVRYTARMGGDVGTGMTDAQKRNSGKALLFGAGYERGFKSTIGASKKGRVWSFQRCNLQSFANWCKSIGRKILDETINPNEVLKGTLEPQLIDAPPVVMPILVDWPEELYRNLESAFSCDFDGDGLIPMHLVSIELHRPAKSGVLKFNVVCEDDFSSFELRLSKTDEKFDYEIIHAAGSKLSVVYRGARMSAEKFFDYYPPVFWFADGSYLDGNHYVELKGHFPLYDKSKIEVWDWAGVDITKESQYIEKRKDSVQRRVIENLLLDKSWEIVIDDDDAGESADVVAIREVDSGGVSEIEVCFYHCKFSAKNYAGARVDDLYVVCGQSQKSIGWLYNSDKKTDLFQHLLKRDPRRKDKVEYSRFERGTRALLTKFKEMSRVRKVNLKVYAVQPGVKASGISAAQSDILAATENYLMETCKVPFCLIASA